MCCFALNYRVGAEGQLGFWPLVQIAGLCEQFMVHLFSGDWTSE